MSDKSKLSLQQQIIEFDHRFVAKIVTTYPGLLPAGEGGADEYPRTVSMVLTKHHMELVEPSGIREVKLMSWPYTQFTSIAWDHQHTSFRVANAKATVPTQSMKKYAVTVGKRDGPLGLALCSTSSAGPGKGLSAAVENTTGQAAECAELKVGHLVLSVNGTDTTDLQFQETMDVLRIASRPIQLEVRECVIV
jgi:hypothetical protein